jgi:thioesterase domain-containing protein
LIEYATLGGLAGLIEAAPSAPASSLLAPMQLKGLKTPLFLAPGGLGDVLYLRDLVKHLGEDHPVYGLQSVRPDLRSKGLASVPDLARRYLAEIRACQPHGPYFLAGHSSGGIIVYEIACQLLQAGERLGLVALIDTNLPGIRPRASPWERARIHARNFAGAADLPKRIAYLRARLERLFVKTIRSTPLLEPAARAGLIPDDRMLLSELLLDTYVPPVLDAPLALFRAARRPPYERLDPLQAWNRYAREIDVVDIPGDHWPLVFDPQARELARRIRERLD